MNTDKRRFRTLFVLQMFFAFLLFTCLSYAQTLAPGAPGKDAQWATAGKQGVGTAANLESKVWFTLAQGVMTEVYYPDVTVANVHLLQFVVVNPKTKKVETEQDDAVHEVKVLRPDSLTFQQINTAKSGEWKITKTYTTDVERDSVLIDVKFEPKNKDLSLYVYYDPSLGNSGMGDSASMLLFSDCYKCPAQLLKSEDKQSGIWSRLFFSSQIVEVDNSFAGNDGLRQLKEYGRIKSPKFTTANDGNVVQVARIVKPERFTAHLMFGQKGSLFSPATVFDQSFDEIKSKYEKGWSDYVKTLRKVEPKYQAQFNMAAMILKAYEDKTVRGANIASLTIPWGGGDNANENNIGGYHLIWSRDLYQVATAYMALGDKQAAIRALDFLFNVQQKEDGSFPQNSFLDGKPFWGSLQLDEVAFPLILAYQLGRNDKKTYENHVKRAADFIVKNGPITPQERWEEESGYSPSTIAAEIAGLVCAADIAQKNGDNDSANRWLKTADEWQSNIEKWTVTTTGKYSKESYYLRITQGKPDSGEKLELNNGAGFFDERDIVDAGFLELVRLGIKSPDDKIIQNSVKVIDQVIRVNTPNGDAFYRYNHDGYGEMDDGRRWNFDGKYTGKGRLWALLSGERGQYEIAFAEFQRNNPKYSSRVTRGELAFPLKIKAISRLESMAKFANNGLMIPEQIWDSPNVPKNADKQFVPELKFGEGTGSATPLAWSMAQFIRLAVNLQEGRNLDTPDVVYNRYVLGKKGESVTSNVQIGGCFFDWQANQSVLQQDDLAKRLKRNPEIWSCDNGDVLAILAYQGQAKKVQIAGDFNSWKPKAEEYEFEDFSTDKTTKIFSKQFKRNARVEYKLIVDGKWILDPLNPNKVDNGVGGENSVFTMPDYKPTSWDKGETPKLETIEIESKLYGKRTIQVYAPKSDPSAVADGLSRKTERSANKSTVSNDKLQPSATADGSVLATLYLQDGTDYVNRAKAIQIQENLVKAGKIKPFIMIFIDYKDRTKEYWASDDYAKFVAEEVVPAIDKQYNTIKSRDGRAILGASLGGITSFHTAVKYPEIFGRVGGQSSSFWVDDERVVKELEKLDVSKNKFTFYIDDGTLEGVEDSRRVNALLRGKGFTVTYIEGETGHNWTSWRDRLADAFMALWK